MAEIKSAIRNYLRVFGTLHAINTFFFLRHQALFSQVNFEYTCRSSGHEFFHLGLRLKCSCITGSKFAMGRVHQAENSTILWLKDPVNGVTISNGVLWKELEDSKEALEHILPSSFLNLILSLWRASRVNNFLSLCSAANHCTFVCRWHLDLPRSEKRTHVLP